MVGVGAAADAIELGEPGTASDEGSSATDAEVVVTPGKGGAGPDGSSLATRIGAAATEPSAAGARP